MNKLLSIRFVCVFIFLTFFHLSVLFFGCFFWAAGSKLSIVLSLLVYLVFYQSKRLGRRPTYVIAGLSLSLCGDAFLVFQERKSVFFIVGLLCFLLAHICYTFFYRQHIRGTDFQQPIKWKWLWQTFIIVYCIVFCLFLNPYLGSLKIPVFAYALVLMLMLLFALNRSGRVPSKSFYYILSGAALFTVSDSVLALNKFVMAFSYSGIITICTYAAAQYLITLGTIFYYQHIKA